MRIRCGYCQGRGTRRLGQVYAETLLLLRQVGPSWAAKLARLAGCEATAMNNRLESLEKMFLVKSRRQGRKRIFEAR